jgi:hypothetical protein
LIIIKKNVHRVFDVLKETNGLIEYQNKKHTFMARENLSTQIDDTWTL